MENLKNYFTEFIALMDVQQFNSRELNYGVLKNHRTQLKQLSDVGNSSVFVFDLFKKEHVFASGLYEDFIDKTDRSAKGIFHFLDQTVHEEDSITLIKRWTTSLKLCYAATPADRKNYKIINDYRIRNKNGDLVRVVDQHQVLELDPQGNIWLSLCLIDISADQNKQRGVKSSIVNFKTGELVWEDVGDERMTDVPVLSAREKEILLLIKDGFLSKEIAKKLFLSVHTLNTHRQRILEKLNVDNSMEAIKYASGVGMIR